MLAIYIYTYVYQEQDAIELPLRYHNNSGVNLNALLKNHVTVNYDKPRNLYVYKRYTYIYIYIYTYIYIHTYMHTYIFVECVKLFFFVTRRAGGAKLL